MLLTLRTTHVPATDLGYLLEKNPARTQRFELAHGTAHVTYPEASEHGCTAALYLEIDPLALKQRTQGEDALLAQYVNDRPYAASSYLAVALGRVFGSAMGGRSRERQALGGTAIPLTATLLPVRGTPELVARLFGPLGYAIDVTPIALDPAFPGWGESPYVRLSIEKTTRLSELLTHLSVLVPVLDGAKHYWVGEDEVEKLLDRGEGWLAAHPERELISRRYLKRQGALTRLAMERLRALDETAGEAATEDDEREAHLERRQALNDARMEAVLAMLERLGAQRVLDAGCGEGRLLSRLLRRSPALTAIAGMDVSPAALARAEERLKLDRLPEAVRQRLTLMQGSLVYGDARLRGFDAICAIEVIEHLPPYRLPSLERVLLREAQPRALLVTTPNREHNVRYGLADGQLRHADHRFEWTRSELRAWAEAAAARCGYTVEVTGIGPEDPEVGPPTQLALFTRKEGAA